MPRAADQFRSSDVTFWGLVALGCWGVAVLLMGVGSLLPGNVMAALHASRLDGANLNQLRAEMAELRRTATQLRRDATQLTQRLDLQGQEQADATRRIGALEVTIPALAERPPDGPAVDPSVTASVVDSNSVSFEADGGSVRVAMRPLPTTRPSPVSVEPGVAEAMPVADGSQLGVALGFPVDPEDGDATWQGLLARVGPLLLGLTPVLAPEVGHGAVIIAGPLPSEAQASELCDRLGRVGIPCELRPFAGKPLPLLN